MITEEEYEKFTKLQKLLYIKARSVIEIYIKVYQDPEDLWREQIKLETNQIVLCTIDYNGDEIYRYFDKKYLYMTDEDIETDMRKQQVLNINVGIDE